jgi:tetratricopeptide (TPR) repeat protein
MIELDAYKFSPDDYFQVGLFRGMLITARASGKLEWMKMLIDEKLKELHPNYIDNMKSYAMGQYYYGMGLYEKALESLIVLKSDYFLYKKDLKNLLFRIYYELGYIEEAYSMLENMKKYLSKYG